MIARAGRGLVVAALAALAGAPLAVVLAAVADPDGEVWSHLWATRLPDMLVTTVVLVVVVTVASVVLGTGLAWLVVAYRFPGRRVVGWLLAAPLALPAYVAGFTWLDLFDVAGPVQGTLRDWFGPTTRLPEVRSLPVAAFVLVGASYPYVYLLARAAFREQSPLYLAAARSLGCRRAAAWWRVALPLARPSLAAGATLVMMETLTDVGTVRLFNVSTVADGVLRVWFGLDDRNAAAELAAVLVAFALTAALLERALRGRARFEQRGGRDRAEWEPTRLRGWRAAAASATVTSVLVVFLGVPLLRLVPWAVTTVADGEARTVSGGFGAHLLDSLVVSTAAVGVTLVGGLFLALAIRRRRLVSPLGLAARLAASGYGVPGPVVAIGVLVCAAWIDRRELLPGGVLLAGSMIVLFYGLAVRYVAVAQQSVEASLTKVPVRLREVARTLGRTPASVVRSVELPLARPGIVAAVALVGMDVVKELPITMLLRPFGVDTLPVWVWQATSESLWEQAAVPGLAITAIAAVLLVVLLVQLERGAEVT